MPKETGVSRAVRVWLGVGTSVLIGAAGAGCSDGGSDAARDTAPARDVAAQAAGGPATAAALPGPSAGGEGEGEGASGADPVNDDVEYLHQLGQTRGHLAAFTALHRLGAHEMSMTHAKHPESELYTGLKPAFEARGKAGFAEELDALTEAVGNGGNVDAAYADLVKAIRENEPDADLATHLMAIATLARTAGKEFAIGVADDGRVVNAHEYQDAFGFLTAAKEMLANEEPHNEQEAQALATAERQLDIGLGEFDTLTASQVDGKASVIHGAAARIEIEANML
jgi:hypothetical protein